MRSLLVEDDLELAEAVLAGLRRRGLPVDHAATIGDADWMLKDADYAALVLDLGLPDGDGIALLKRLRARRQGIPVLVLTARGEVADRLLGLESGGDDYLVKPFDMNELAARLRAVMRRGALHDVVLEVGNLRFDIGSRELCVGAAAVALSAREADLIGLLLRRPDRVFTKQQVENQLYGLGGEVTSNALEVQVHRLRRKLDGAGADVSIETVRGIGYILRAPA